MDAVRLAVIGAGNMGRSLAQAAEPLDIARVVCVADVDPSRAHVLADECSARAAAPQGALGSHDVDAVLVAAPNHLHCDLTIQAAQAGKHVFCEKPMALSVGDCRKMIAACEEAGVKLMIGQVLRYLPVFATIAEVLAAEDFGRRISMTTCRIAGGWAGGVWDVGWRGLQDQSGGVLFEVSQHELDFMRCVLGEAHSVFSLQDHFVRREVDYADDLHVLIRFESGAIGSLHAGLAAVLGAYDGKILCEKGAIFYDNTGGEVTVRLEEGDTTTINARERQFEPGTQRELREFCEAVLRDEEPAIPGIEGLRNVALAEAAVESARTGRPVRVSG